MKWFTKLFHLKSRKEIREEVKREPKIERALKGLQRVDRILLELQAIEGRRR